MYRRHSPPECWRCALVSRVRSARSSGQDGMGDSTTRGYGVRFKSRQRGKRKPERGSPHRGRNSHSRSTDRDASSIYRKLERNRWNNSLWLKLSPLERALKGNELAQRRQKEAKRGRESILEQAQIRELVISLLKDTRASPETIAQIICRHELGGPISGKTKRRFIVQDYPALLKECPHRGKRPRKSVTPKKKSKTSFDRLSIHERGKRPRFVA